MLPRMISCEECGETAQVRGYGRVEYRWQESDPMSAQVDFKTIRLTIDCPRCGVRVQDHHPDHKFEPVHERQV